MIEVFNAGDKLWPGMTATVRLNGAQVERTVRIPNGALSFRPSNEVLAAIGQGAEQPMGKQEIGADDPMRRIVWRFDGKRFTPIEVHVGLADREWTALTRGELRPGEGLVTNAVLPRRR